VDTTAVTTIDVTMIDVMMIVATTAVGITNVEMIDGTTTGGGMIATTGNTMVTMVVAMAAGAMTD